MPFAIRFKGNAVTQGTSRAASAFNQFVNPIGLQAIGWKFYLVYVGVLFAQIVIVYFAYPETNGLTLEEVSIVLESNSSASAQVLKPEMGSTEAHVENGKTV